MKDTRYQVPVFVCDVFAKIDGRKIAQYISFSSRGYSDKNSRHILTATYGKTRLIGYVKINTDAYDCIDGAFGGNNVKEGVYDPDSPLYFKCGGEIFSPYESGSFDTIDDLKGFLKSKELALTLNS